MKRIPEGAVPHRMTKVVLAVMDGATSVREVAGHMGVSPTAAYAAMVRCQHANLIQYDKGHRWSLRTDLRIVAHTPEETE